MNKVPFVSIIIPSYDGYRGGNVPKLIEDIKNQSFKNFELHIVKGVKPNGKARNEGVKNAKGEILVFIDDDVRLGNSEVIKNLIEPFSQYKTIGISGTSRFLPPDANKFQKIAEVQIPRSYFPIVERITESDMATHDCIAIPKDIYEKVGMENEFLLRGTDPDLRFRVRKAGFKTIIVANTWIYHPLPQSLAELAKKSFNNGMGSGWVFRHYPEFVYEVPEHGELPDVARRSFLYRVIRVILRIILALITFKFLRLIFTVSYGIGYLYGMIASEKTIKKRIY